jgi:hypothetical protein
VPKALVRYAHNAHAYDISKAEKSLQEKILQPIPEQVSSDSSTRQVTGEVQSKAADYEEVDMMAGIRSDFVGGRRVGDFAGTC